jgi:hypothetical protein
LGDLDVADDSSMEVGATQIYSLDSVVYDGMNDPTPGGMLA